MVSPRQHEFQATLVNVYILNTSWKSQFITLIQEENYPGLYRGHLSSFQFINFVITIKSLSAAVKKLASITVEKTKVHSRGCQLRKQNYTCNTNLSINGKNQHKRKILNTEHDKNTLSYGVSWQKKGKFLNNSPLPYDLTGSFKYFYLQMHNKCIYFKYIPVRPGQPS